jgi:hypothetical protein
MVSNNWGQLLGLLLDVFHNQNELLVSDFPIVVGVKLHYQIIHYTFSFKILTYPN